MAMRRIKLGSQTLALTLLTLVLAPLQNLAMALNWRLAGRLPHLWHRIACRIAGIKVRQIGAPLAERPLLIVANHASWIDITAIGSALPVSFIAKSEVGTWPIFGWLARMQRTIFVERQKRANTGQTTKAIAKRLANGDPMLLFAEGTTSDGNRVLPFRSALLGAAQALASDRLSHNDMGYAHMGHAYVQPLGILYHKRDGLPLGRAERTRIAWHGDMELPPHLAEILAGGPVEIVLIWGDALPMEAGSDRKRLTRALEETIRRSIAQARRR
jgi:lyso-ornithine lipid O-acyltransferase